MFNSQTKNPSPLTIEGNFNSTIVGNDNTINNSFFESARLLPSTLATVVNALGKKLPETDAYIEVPDFSIEHKKDYNNVLVYRAIMDEYGILTGKLTAVYAICDAEGTDITYNTLNNIKLQYIKVRSSYVLLHPKMPVIEVVRLYADKIFEGVEQLLLTNVISSSNVAVSKESVHLSLQVVMIDAFIKCNILEHPTKNAAA